MIFAQNRSLPESATGGFLLAPALIASQPQGLALNFSVSPTSFFGIDQASGTLFLQAGVALSYITQSIYPLTVTAVSSAGTQASATVVVHVTQVRAQVQGCAEYSRPLNRTMVSAGQQAAPLCDCEFFCFS